MSVMFVESSEIFDFSSFSIFDKSSLMESSSSNSFSIFIKISEYSVFFVDKSSSISFLMSVRFAIFSERF